MRPAGCQRGTALHDLLTGIDHGRLRCFGRLSSQGVARHQGLRTLCPPLQQNQLFFEQGKNIPVTGDGGFRLVAAKLRLDELRVQQGQPVAKIRGVLLCNDLTFFNAVAKLEILQGGYSVHCGGDRGHAAGGDPTLHIREDRQHILSGLFHADRGGAAAKLRKGRRLDENNAQQGSERCCDLART